MKKHLLCFVILLMCLGFIETTLSTGQEPFYVKNRIPDISTRNSENKMGDFLSQSDDKTGKWVVFAEDDLQPNVAQDVRSTEEQLKERVRALLGLYGRKDVAGLMQFFDEKNVLMMGADASEVASSKKDIEKLLRDDFALWESSKFGEFKNFYANFSDKTATAFFDVPWEANLGSGQSRKFLIRFATVWRKANGEWKLVQILNTVPTVGQSAGEIIEQTKKKPEQRK